MIGYSVTPWTVPFDALSKLDGYNQLSTNAFMLIHAKYAIAKLYCRPNTRLYAASYHRIKYGWTAIEIRRSNCLRSLGNVMEFRRVRHQKGLAFLSSRCAKGKRCWQIGWESNRQGRRGGRLGPRGSTSDLQTCLFRHGWRAVQLIRRNEGIWRRMKIEISVYETLKETSIRCIN